MFQQNDRKWLPQTDRPHGHLQEGIHIKMLQQNDRPQTDPTGTAKGSCVSRCCHRTTDPTDAFNDMSMSRRSNKTTDHGNIFKDISTSTCHNRTTDPTDTCNRVSISRRYNRTTDPTGAVKRICVPRYDRPHGRLERDFPCQYMLSWNDRLHGRLRELPCQDSATEIQTLQTP